MPFTPARLCCPWPGQSYLDRAVANWSAKPRAEDGAGPDSATAWQPSPSSRTERPSGIRADSIPLAGRVLPSQEPRGWGFPQSQSHGPAGSPPSSYTNAQPRFDPQPMRLPLHGRTPAWLGTHSRGKPTQSIRCRHSPRRLRTREALGVRQLDGAVEERHPARRPPTPLLPSTNDRIFGRPEGIPLQARPHPSPQRNLSRSSQNPRRGASVEGIPPSEAVERVLPMLKVVQAVPSVA